MVMIMMMMGVLCSGQSCVIVVMVMIVIALMTRLVIRLMEVEEFDHPTLRIVNETQAKSLVIASSVS